MIGGIVALAGVIALSQSPGIAVTAPGLAPHRVSAVGWAPAWTPDGRRLAVVVRGDLWTMDADGSHARQLTLTPGAENQPAWSPDGRHLAFTRDGAVWTIRADGENEQRVAAAGASPTWSPDGTRIAYDDGTSVVVESLLGGGPRALVEGTSPAWSPDGRRIAYVADDGGQLDLHLVDVASGKRSRVTYDPGDDTSPAWSPDGRRLAYVREGAVWLVAADGTGRRRLATGTDPSWQPLPRRAELLPDLDQRPPAGLVVTGGPGAWHLGFHSAIDNVGDGPLVVEGIRRGPVMHVTQRVRLAGRGAHTYPDVGLLRYANVDDHHHWHYVDFDRYELLRPDGSFVVRDHKSGFCMADHYGQAPGKLAHRVPHPVFSSNCAAGDPSARTLEEGVSVGYTDRYPANFHGQYLNLTGVPAGTYVLLHRASPNMLLRELRYDNDAASLLIRLAWRSGVPRVTVLKACDSARCGD